jgi:hypothetical protein
MSFIHIIENNSNFLLINFILQWIPKQKNKEENHG